MTKIFEHILIPYNGYSGSQKAFKKAVALAQIAKSKITILTCIEERSTFGLFKTKTSKKEVENEQKSITLEHEKLGKYANEYNVLVNSKIITSNSPSLAILEFAEKHNVDLIVMGMNRRNRYEKRHYPTTVEDISKNFNGAILILN